MRRRQQQNFLQFFKNAPILSQMAFCMKLLVQFAKWGIAMYLIGRFLKRPFYYHEFVRIFM